MILSNQDKRDFFNTLQRMLRGDANVSSNWHVKDEILAIYPFYQDTPLCFVKSDGTVECDKANIKTYAESVLVNRVRKVVANAMEKVELALTAQVVSVPVEGSRSNREYTVLARFRNIMLLEEATGWGPYYFYVWREDSTLDMSKATCSYIEAKKMFANEANLVRGSLEHNELEAIYRAILFYRENAQEDRPINMSFLDTLQRRLLRACPEAECATDTFDRRMWGEPSYPDYDGDDDNYDDDDELSF